MLDLDRLFASDLKYLRKVWDLLCISYLSKLIENTLSFVLNLVLRRLGIVFWGTEISKFSRGAHTQTPLQERE